MTQNFIFNPPFNFSLATLNKINDEMKNSDYQLKARDLVKYYTAVEVVYKNTWPFFSPEQQKELKAIWDNIQKLPLEIGEDYIEYEEELPVLLKQLDFLIVEYLHKNGVSFSNRDQHKGIDQQYIKYGINSES